MTMRKLYLIKQKILSLPESNIFSAENKQKKEEVIIKISINKLVDEFNLAQKLDINYIKNIEYKDFENSYIIEMPYNNKAFLSDIISQKDIKVVDFFKISYKLLDLVDCFHSKRFIINFLNPSIILISPDFLDLKLIDWSLVTEFEYAVNKQISTSYIYNFSEYIAPEQTGRLPDSIDYRTDYYLLGILLYELFTGHPPFKSADPFETVYEQIAINAAPLERKSEDNISGILSGIILKLIEKNPDDRYQSVSGIRADLEKAEAMYKSGIYKPFELGSKDVSPIFHIPEKVYNRDKEKQILEKSYIDSLDNKVSTLFVAGYSGIGKTCLINELRKTVTLKKGYFVSGKFDLLSRTIPYKGISQALGKLCGIILSEPQKRLEEWKNDILEAVGNSGQILIDIIPELELIIGHQPQISEMSAEARQNLFKATFARFINVFTGKDSSLVLFVDDLQWVDIQTLDLIKYIITFNPDQKLTLIGAYRSNEIKPWHPLQALLNDLKKEKADFINIELEKLPSKDINNLCADTLRKSSAEVRDLSNIVEQKTGGNPFFIKLFLNNLYKINLIKYSEQKQWEWDIAEISYQTATENVGDLLKNTVNEFKGISREILIIGSCIGNIFNRRELSIVLKLMNPDKEIKPLIEAGILIYRESQYKFAHDRFQEAAYNLLPEEKRPQKHLEIARRFCGLYKESRDESLIFKIVEQYNRGIYLLTEFDEKILVTKLNLKAAKKAKVGHSYSIALQYLESVLLIFPQEKHDYNLLWQQQYELMFDFYLEYTELLYFNQQFEKSEKVIAEVIPFTKGVLDKNKLKHLLITQNVIRNRDQEAFKVGLEILRDLGMDFPLGNYEQELEKELTLNRKLMKGRSVSSILDLPNITDPKHMLIVKILNELFSVIFLMGIDVMRILIVKTVNATLQYGLVPETSGCYIWFGGVVINDLYQKYNEGFEYGQTALVLSKRFGNPTQIGRDLIGMALSILFWVQHLRNTIDMLKEAYKYSYYSGDLRHMGYVQVHFVIETFMLGMPIFEILENSTDIFEFARKTGFVQAFLDCVNAGTIIQWNLAGKTFDRHTFNNQEMNEADFLQSQKSLHSLGFYTILKSQIHYYYEEFEEALKWSEKSTELLPFLLGFPLTFEYVLYQALILIALYPSRDPDIQANYRKTIEKHLEQYKIWANYCPDNFEHRYLIIEAEYQSKITGNQNVINEFETAISSAEKTGYVQIQALACELYAKFWLKKNNPDIAKIYFTEARSLYEKWGAIRKVECLEEFYPEMFVLPEQVISLKEVNLGKLIDINTIINATYVLAGELNIEELISKMLKIISKNTGVQNSVFIHQKDINDYLLAIFNAEQDFLEIRYIKSIESSIYFPSSILNYVFRTGKSVLLEQADKENIFADDIYFQENKPKSVFCTPIKSQDKVFSVLYLENRYIENTFNQAGMDFISIILSQCAISIENSRLLEIEKQTAERERLLRNIIETTRNTLDINEIKKSIVNSVRKAFNADRVVLSEFDSERNIFLPAEKCAEVISDPKLFSFVGYDWTQDIIQPFIKPLTQKKEVNFSNLYNYIKKNNLENTGIKELFESAGIKSSYNIPVMSGENLMGYFCIDFKDVDHLLTPEDLEFARVLANQTGIGLSQARLYESVKQTAKKESILREIISEIKISQTQEEVHKYITQKMANVYGTSRAIFLEVFSPEEGFSEIKYQYTKSPKIKKIKLSDIPERCFENLFRDANEYGFINIENTEKYYKEDKEIQAFFKQFNIKSIIMAPLIRYDDDIKILGVLTLCLNKSKKLSKEETDLITSVAGSTVSVLWEMKKRAELDELRNVFILTLTHDLQVPLVGERKALEFLASRHGDSPIKEFKDIINAIISNNEKLTAHLKRLLENYTYESGKKILDISEHKLPILAENVIDSLKHSAYLKNITIETQMDKDLPSVYIDRKEVEKVISILLENAIEYIDKECHIIIKISKEKDRIITCIIDNGPGIPEETREKIFQRYAMAVTIERRIGAGLSLYLAKQIVEAHKGKIWYKTEKGKGTSFCFSFPVTKPK